MSSRQTVEKIGFILLGTIVLSFGFYNFYFLNHITEGGVLGLLLLLQHVFNISPSITSVVIDFSLFTIGSKFFGKKFLLYSILSTITFSSTYKIWEKIGFLVPSFTNNMLIASILAGIGVGVGVGLVVRGGGASGGDDVIALLGNKLLKLKVNHVYLATDAIVLLMSLVYLDIKQVFFSIIAVTISGKIISIIYKDDEDNKDNIEEIDDEIIYE